MSWEPYSFHQSTLIDLGCFSEKLGRLHAGLTISMGLQQLNLGRRFGKKTDFKPPTGGQGAVLS